MTDDDELENALGCWLECREDQPELLPGEFAQRLAEPLRSAFLRELEDLAEIDRATSLAPPRDLPRRFGDFRVLGQLGQGAMGAVYLAEQVSLARRVALKVLHPQVAGDLRSAARFQREARTAASLVHPGIVPVLGFGEEQGFSWLAMGLVGGRSLQRLLQAWVEPRDIDHARSCALLDDSRAVALAFAGAADALDFAHRKNVVHRDVKPANLMCGDDGRLVVLDFGLASARAGDDTTASLTRTGDFLGTPLYMAPEQTAGADCATASSDVYAVGAVLYECLCGRPPVTPGPLPQVLDHIRSRDPEDPRRHRADVPAELAHVAMMCLEKDPRQRYHSAAELADDLRRYCDGKPVHARGLGPVRRLGRRLRRRPAAAAAMLLGVLALLLAVLLQDRGIENETLGKDNELREIRATLALSPEGITVFGGASRRWYALLGLGDHLPPAEAAVSAAARDALRRAEQLASRHPDDIEIRRAFARALLDVGSDPDRTDEVLDGLLAMQAAPAVSDRAMRAVWLLQQDRVDAAETAWRELPATADATTCFWRGIWQQTRQDYGAAIGEFDAALRETTLREGALPEELRYFALLHRGWCKTCPEIGQRRAAEDDLLQAAALRPGYGTARLLWAGLRCLDPEEDLARPVTAVTEVLTAVQMEPWVVTLVARVLLAFAQASSLQGERLHLVEFSPLVAQPLTEERRLALAGKALALLESLQQSHPDLVEPRIHRVGALTILGRHDAALAAADELAARMRASHRALPQLLRARVLLADGRTAPARQAIDAAVAADPGYVDAWRTRADLLARVGNLDGELAALERAVLLLRELRQHASVFPEAAVALPGLQLRRAATLLAAGRARASLEVLDEDFGGPLAGANGPRVRCERLVLRARAFRGLGDPGAAAAAAAAVTAIEQTPADAPLRAMLGWLRPEAASHAGTDATAAAVQRGWMPVAAALVEETADPQWLLLAAATALEWPAAAEAALAAQLAPFTRTVLAADDPRLGGLLPLLRRVIPDDAEAAAALLRLAEQAGADGDHSEARLLKAAVLLATGRAAAAATFLADTQHLHPDDLRGRWLQACAALQADDEPLAREALRLGDRQQVTPALLIRLRERTAVPVADAIADRLSGWR